MSEEGVRKYERYNLAFWLHKVAPECEETSSAFKRLQEANPEFKPREHPDLDFYVTVGWGDPGSAAAAHELLKLDPETQFETICNAPGPDLLKAAELSSGRGLAVLDKAARSKYWGEHLWGNLLKGIDSPSHSEDEMRSVLELSLLNIIEIPRTDDVLRVLASVFERATKHPPAAKQLIAERREHLQEFVEILQRQFLHSPSIEIEWLQPDSGTDWLGYAINHPGGDAALGLIHLLDSVEPDAPEADEARNWAFEQLKECLAHTGTAFEVAARVSMFWQFGYMYSRDFEWAKDNLLPLLDWSNKKVAQQSWHGLLGWSSYTEPLVRELLPYYEGTFDHIQDLGHRRGLNDWPEVFCSRIALFAVHGPVHPLDGRGWLFEFVRKASAEHLREFAVQIGQRLSGLDTSGVELIWEKWLHRYWQNRINGIPRGIEADEVWPMLEWFPDLLPVADEALACIRESPSAPVPQHTSLFYGLAREVDVEANPEAVAEFILLSLCDQRSFIESWRCSDLVSLAERLAVALAAERREVWLGQLATRLYELQCIDAERADQLHGKSQDPSGEAT
jgi:hypothetical protein